MTSNLSKSLKFSTNSAFTPNKVADRTQSSIAVITTTYTFKIIFIGDSSVGKTSIITKFCEDKFDPENATPTIGLAEKSKIIKIDPYTEVKFDIWDTAGSEKFGSITKNYYHDSNGIILVFDLTNEKSFKNIDFWMKEINDIIDENKVVKFLVGNKSDLEDIKIDDKMAEKYAGENGMKFVKISTKDGVNIDYLFEVLGNDIVKKMQDLQEKNEIIEEQKNEIIEEKSEQYELNKEEKQNKQKMDALSIEGKNVGKKNSKKNKKCC